MVEEKAKSFIKSYAFYHGSCRPESRLYYSMGSDDKGVTTHSIRHAYQIKAGNGQSIRVTSDVVLGPKLHIPVIAHDSTFYIGSYPPKIDDWLNDCRRNLQSKDSLLLPMK